MPEEQKQPMDPQDRRKWIQLQRLLYRMEKQPTPLPGQGWQSLVLRAQLCQDLWQDVAGLVENYDAVAARVDRLCHKAHELAAHQREQEQQSDRASLLDRLFGSQSVDTPVPEEEEEENDAVDELEEEQDFDSETEENMEASTISTPRPTSQPSESLSLQDLQKQQREQMEEAIGLMAQQMKEATRGIQNTIQQQTQTTLHELEDAAEQNVQDVTKVAKNVTQHNQVTRRRNFATWTLIFTMVGIFCFCMMTIFTIPKRPGTCLLFCKEGSLVQNLVKPVWSVGKTTYATLQTLFHDRDMEEGSEQVRVDILRQHEELLEEDELERKQKEELNKLLREMDEERPKVDVPEPSDEQLDKLLRDLKEQQKKAGRDEVVYEQEILVNPQEDENPWGAKPVRADKAAKLKMESNDDENPWGAKPVRVEAAKPSSEAAENEVKLPKTSKEEPSAASDTEQDVGDVNIENLMASLDKQKAKQAGSGFGFPDEPMGGGGGGGDHFERAGEAQMRFSPRDVRVAAGAGELEQLQEYLQHQPDYLNRPDKNGWTALHFAVRRGQTEIVRYMLQLEGIEPLLETNDGQTAMQVAEERLGNDHQVTRILLSHGTTSVAARRDRQKQRQQAHTILSQMQAEDEQKSYDDYLQIGRSRLNTLDLETGDIPSRGRKPIPELNFEDAEDDEEKLRQARSRLDKILGPEDDEL